MTISQQLSPDVLTDIENRVKNVKSCFKTATSAWLNVAKQFAQAKADLTQIAFERFVNDVGLTKAVSDKLLIIGGRRIMYDPSVIDHISTAEGWTVLYELAKLDDKKIEEVVGLVKSDPSVHLTRALIQNIANNRPLDENA